MVDIDRNSLVLRKKKFSSPVFNKSSLKKAARDPSRWGTILEREKTV